MSTRSCVSLVQVFVKVLPGVELLIALATHHLHGHVRGHLRGADLRHLGMVGGQVLHEIRLGGELLLAEGTHQETRTT